MKRSSKIVSLLLAVMAMLIMSLPVSAFAAANKEVPTVNLTTAKKSISKCKVTVSATVTYTGKALKPAVTVKDGKTTLKSGKHYTVKYSNNTNVGTAKITVTGKGNYSGKVTVSFKIVPGKPAVTAKSSTTSVTLSWKSVKGAKTYAVYSYNTSTKKYTKIATVSTTKYTVKNLTSCKTYVYAVKAVNGNFASFYSSLVKATTLPFQVNGIKATANLKSLVLSWSKVSGATGYTVYKYDASTKKYTALKTLTGTSYTVSSLQPGTKYSFAVAAYNKDNAYGKKSAVFTASTKAVTAPAQIKITSATSTYYSATINWAADKNASGYFVYSYDKVAKKFTQIAKLGKVTTYTAKNLDPEKQYGYAVVGFKTYDKKDYKGTRSAVKYITTAAVPTPAKIAISSSSSTLDTVIIRWNAASNASGYRVYSVDANGKYTLVKDTGKNNYFKATGLSFETSYSYAVVGYKTYNSVKYEGIKSDIVEISTKPLPKSAIPEGLEVTETTATTISLKWNTAENASGYYIYYYNAEIDRLVVMADVGNTTTYTLTKCESAKVHNLALASYYTYKNKNYESEKTDFVTAVTYASTPTNVQVYSYTKNSLTVMWNKSKGADKYAVYSYNPETKELTFLKNTTSTTSYIFDVEENVDYSFAVKAIKTVDGKNYDSDLSDIVTAKISNTVPAKFANYYNIFRGGNFGVTFNIPTDTGTNLKTTAYTKNNNVKLTMAANTDGMNMDIDLIYLNDKSKGFMFAKAAILEGSSLEMKIYSEMSKKDFEEQGGMTADVLKDTFGPQMAENKSFTLTTKKVGNATYDCISYVTDSGKIITYYFTGDTLSMVNEMKYSNGESTMIEISNVYSSVNDKEFNLPSGFWFLGNTLMPAIGWINADSLA